MTLEGAYQNVWDVMKILKYNGPGWGLCASIKIMNFPFEQHGGYTKYCVFSATGKAERTMSIG